MTLREALNSGRKIKRQYEEEWISPADDSYWCKEEICSDDWQIESGVTASREAWAVLVPSIDHISFHRELSSAENVMEQFKESGVGAIIRKFRETAE